jgi:hypothetical protein
MPNKEAFNETGPLVNCGILRSEINIYIHFIIIKFYYTNTSVSQTESEISYIIKNPTTLNHFTGT